MFKLFIMYCVVIQPGYQLNGAHVVAGFKTKADCEIYAVAAAKELTVSPFYRGGTHSCEKDSK